MLFVELEIENAIVHAMASNSNMYCNLNIRIIHICLLWRCLICLQRDATIVYGVHDTLDNNICVDCMYVVCRYYMVMTS